MVAVAMFKNPQEALTKSKRSGKNFVSAASMTHCGRKNIFTVTVQDF